MATTGKNYELKMFIDKKQGRVLFAEADGDFVGHLFSFLTLPLVTLVRVIRKKPSEQTLGSFRCLIRSAASLGNEYFRAVQFKAMLLRPGSREIVNFNKALKFIITDHLQVTPVVPGTILGSLNNLGTIDADRIEERIVKLGLNELIEFVKCSLLSTAPLTDLFVSNTAKPVSSVKLSLKKLIEVVKCTLLSTTPSTDPFGASRLSLSDEKLLLLKKPSVKDRKINVKVVLNKSSKKFLYVEAGSDFIDFLFGLLLIPLGQMLHVLEGQSGLGSIDGLYKSAQSQRFFIQPRDNYLLRPSYTWNNHTLELELISKDHNIGVSRTLSMGDLGFVRNEAVFIVLDDLTVKSSSTAEAVSIMNAHKTSFSDLEERTVSVGVAEGLSILRASLNSNKAISNGLLGKNIVFKEPKQEK